MADILELTPQLLIEQSQELAQLKESYGGLFQAVISDLNGVNSCWSELLANNFSGKIQSAQQSFNGILAMLQNGVSAVSLASSQLGTSDKSLASIINGALGMSVSPDAISALKIKGGFDSTLEQFKESLSPSQKAWIELLMGKAEKGAASESDIGKLNSMLKKAKEKIAEGDMRDGIESLGSDGIKELLDKYAEIMDTKKEGLIGEPDFTKDYYINLTKRTSEMFAERWNGDPTDLKTLCKYGRNVSVQPVLDTTSDKIYKFTSLIPGTSEYYASRGAKNGADMVNIALGDFYSVISPDPEMAQYASTYFPRTGSAFGGIEKFAGEVGSFVKDSGGIGNAVSNFAKTAQKDIGDSLQYAQESMGYFAKATDKYVNNIFDFVNESGSVKNAAINFGVTAAKDTGSAIADTASKIWHAAFGSNK